MQNPFIIALRTGVVLTVLVTMPVLAIPSINHRVNSLLRNESEMSLRERPATVQRHAAAAPAESGRAVGDPSHAGPHVAAHSGPHYPMDPGPRSVQQRLLELRGQLEGLGAEYLLLETSPDQAGQYRFLCTVRGLSAAGPIRTFESVDRDPVRAMATVAAEVRVWRTTAHRLPKTR